MLSVKLKELRVTTTKLTQSEFAKKIDVARTTYAMYEQGNREPDYETLQKIADYYDVTTDYLLGRSANTRNNHVVVAGQEINLTTEELELFNELKKHPVMFHDLASDPEQKVKELLKMYKMKKMFLEDDNEEYGDGFGDLED